MPLTGPVADEVEALRRRWDPVMATIAPAHLTVSYPEEADDERLLLRRAGMAVSRRRPFRLRLGEAFARDGGVFLGVCDADGAWRELRGEVLAPPFRRLDFPPHVTVAHPRTSTLGPECLRALVAGWRGGREFEVHELCHTETSGTFTVLERFRLREVCRGQRKR